jgi:hypothetical protein
LSFAENQNGLGIVGIRLIDGAGNFLPESKRGVPTPFVSITRITGLFKLSSTFFGKYYAQHLKKEEAGKVDILVGAFMIMERSHYLQLGGFDENCFMYSDDIDLSYCSLKSGKANYYLGSVAAIHYKGESTLRDEKYMKRFREAMDFFYRKHFRRSHILDFFLRTGSYLFVLAKKKKPIEVEKIIDRFVLISNDVNLQMKLQEITKKEVTLLPEFGGLTPTKNITTEVFFDASYTGFEQIISIMQVLTSKNVTFKIIDTARTFAIGSNSPTDRGKVIKLADHR